VEVKCPHESTFLDVLLNREQSAAYQMYWCQVQQQILVAEAARGFLFFYHQGQYVEFVIERDEAFLTQLIETAMDFWSAVKTGGSRKKIRNAIFICPKEMTNSSGNGWPLIIARMRRR
jgi:hypothetical protein